MCGFFGMGTTTSTQPHLHNHIYTTTSTQPSPPPPPSTSITCNITSTWDVLITTFSFSDQNSKKSQIPQTKPLQLGYLVRQRNRHLQEEHSSWDIKSGKGTDICKRSTAAGISSQAKEQTFARGAQQLGYLVRQRNRHLQEEHSSWDIKSGKGTDICKRSTAAGISSQAKEQTFARGAQQLGYLVRQRNRHLQEEHSSWDI